MALDLTDYANKNDIEFYLFNFTDLFGTQRAKLVPAGKAGAVQQNGAGFAPFAAWMDYNPAHPDMLVIPDTDSMIQLPWNPKIAWIAGDCWMEGELVGQAPRNVLKKLMAESAKQGLLMKAGVEPEFHIITPEGSAISDERDVQMKPCYDQSTIMRRIDVITEISSTMTHLGWNPYQCDHEDANGQYEINWDFSDALTCADQTAFFKFMVKSIAEKHGLRATFMPKPFSHLTGNGCHVHVSMWSTDEKTNKFADPAGELGLSEMAYHFIGGLLEHAESLAAITNPTVNSYKRINAPPTLSGASWSPSSITFGGNNRTHMIRIPDEGRIEHRLPDNSANPYLLMSGLLAAGMDGITKSTPSGDRLDINMYTDAHTVPNVRKLPLNLLDAIRLFEANEGLRNAMGAEFSQAYINLKNDEWNRYACSLSDWERENTLDC